MPVSPYMRALLDTIAGSESPGYDVVYGGQRVSDLSRHPGIKVPIKSGPNAGKTSSAAGRYQMLERTWQDQARKLGLSDFGPESQDLAAANLAREAYAGITNRSLDEDLQSGDPGVLSRVGKILSGVWTSLPGGIEQNKTGSSFTDRLTSALSNLSPIRSAEASEAPDLASKYGLVPDEEADEEANLKQELANESGGLAEKYGLVPDDEQDNTAEDMAAIEAIGGNRGEESPSRGFGVQHGITDFLSGAGSELARMGGNLVGNIRRTGHAFGADENPAAPSPILTPEHLQLLSATLKRDSGSGKAGEFVGGLVPYMAAGPLGSIALAGATAPEGEQLSQGGLAAAGAGLGALAGRAIGGFRPSAEAARLMDEGVQPTLGQGIEQNILGKGIRKLEEASTSLPLAGATTRHARDRAAEEAQRWIFSQAEGPVGPGLKISAGGKIGNDGMENLYQSFRNAYATVLKGQPATLTDDAIASASNLLDDPLMFADDARRAMAKKFVASNLEAAGVSGPGTVSAEALQRAADNIGQQGASLLKSADKQDAAIGRMLASVDDYLSAQVEAGLPAELKGVMSNISNKYANFKRIQRAVKSSNDASGNFSPGQFWNAIRSADTSLDKSRFARGSARMQDIAKTVKAVIPETLGESGTTPRALVAKLAAGGVEGAAMLGDLATYGGLSGLMGAGSLRPIQRALLGGYGWQEPASLALRDLLAPSGAYLAGGR